MRLIILLFCLSANVIFAQELKSPEEFLNSDYGLEFTPHHQLVSYAEHVATNSEWATFEIYGYTNQDRPLVKLTITTPDNLDKLESIRSNHFEQIEKNNGAADKAIVWLSFGVHGNEAGASESSMNVMYQLASGRNAQAKEWLENTVVIMDPCINPDGYSRYSHWNRNIATSEVQPELYAREHHEPWPGGRVNHYLFDLNRDWAWVTQVESRQRIKKYNEWLPHIHVDFHEMGHDAHYYFAPAAKPYHESITEWQYDFQVEIGKNHAKYFDEEGWLFFTKETFDLLYPSYGDTYPMLNGAIGMTYEQAGHSRAGRAIFLENQDTLTLRDRIDHHSTTALSTIEVASKNSDKLNFNIGKFYSSNPEAQYMSYIVKRPENDNLDELRLILDAHGIEYGQAGGNSTGNGFNYKTGKEETCSFDKGDLIINTDQKKSVLISTLFDPEPGLEDSITYDITAWSLPMAMGLDACALTRTTSSSDFEPYRMDLQRNEKATAYAIPTEHSTSYKLVTALLAKGVKCRYTKKDIQYEDRSIKKGAVIITQADNRKNENWRKTFFNTCEELQIPFINLNTGFALSGPDLGSRSVQFIDTPKVGTISGTGLNGNSFGQLWYYFEQELKYPLIIVDKDNFGASALADLDVLILEEGWYNLSSSQMNEIDSWINKGGKLITIGSATQKFLDKDGYGLKSKENTETIEKADAQPSNYAGEERQYISGSIPGSVIQAEMDHSHPLCFGLGNSTYHSIRAGSRIIPMQQNVRNAIYVPNNYVSYGFIGSRVKEDNNNSLVAGVENKGRGTVIYLADNPIYRGFWKAGNRLLFNAVFLVEE